MITLSDFWFQIFFLQTNFLQSFYESHHSFIKRKTKPRSIFCPSNFIRCPAFNGQKNRIRIKSHCFSVKHFNTNHIRMEWKKKQASNSSCGIMCRVYVCVRQLNFILNERMDSIVRHIRICCMYYRTVCTTIISSSHNHDQPIANAYACRYIHSIYLCAWCNIVHQYEFVCCVLCVDVSIGYSVGWCSCCCLFHFIHVEWVYFAWRLLALATMFLLFVQTLIEYSFLM